MRYVLKCYLLSKWFRDDTVPPEFIELSCYCHFWRIPMSSYAFLQKKSKSMDSNCNLPETEVHKSQSLQSKEVCLIKLL